MPPHILVVEDEEPLLELLRYNFEKAGTPSRQSPMAIAPRRA
jgi:DNA-binding response OmpR family regulator